MQPTEEQLANRAEWLATLRSGTIQQGSGVMLNPVDNSMCCLGVAAVLAHVPQDGTRRLAHGHDCVVFKFPENGYDDLVWSYPPDNWFAERFGIEEIKRGHDISRELAGMNDHNHPFTEIATRAEQLFKGADES